MNPDVWTLALLADQRAYEDRKRSEHRARLHNAAVARRREAKRGGKR